MDDIKPKITFINHASVLLKYDNISLLSDPWYDGAAFNNGWNLLKETPEKSVYEMLAELSHIWISHEHPDHFSVSFFKKFEQTIKENNIQVLFQKTKDRRVYKFLTKVLSLDVIELEEMKWLYLSDDVKVTVKCFGVYDSSLFVKAGQTIIANQNDCHISKSSELGNLSKELSSVDVPSIQLCFLEANTRIPS